MAINPNILKLNISKAPITNSHYLNKNKEFQEDIYIRKFIEGFFFSLNLFTSEIIINRSIHHINISFLLYSSSSFPVASFPLSPLLSFSLSHSYPSKMLKKESCYNYSPIYIKNKNLLIFLSEYLSFILKTHLRVKNLSFNIKFIHNKNNNISILSKFLTKELILNPRQFKFLIKSLIHHS